MPSYSHITVIYNPISTGPGEQLGHRLEKQLKQILPEVPVECVKTEHRGHAREIAYHAALASSKPLIISASGDGGYNEVINGVMQAQQEKPRISPTTGLLAAGNANDHFNTLHQDDLAKLITSDQAQQIDILKLVTTSAGRTIVRYAHSYIGLGLTPQVGLELNKTKLNKLNEMLICLKALVAFRPTHLRVNGRRQVYSSLILSNIDRMAKYLTLSKNSSITDGKFEVVAFRSANRFQLIYTLLKASTIGLSGHRHEASYECETIKPTVVQVDGEIIKVDANVSLRVTAEHRALRCIV